MRIGHLADATGTTTKALRFYEAQGLLALAARTSSGYRDYPRETVSRIRFIHRGQAAGLTLAQLRQILDLRDRGQPPCTHVQGLLQTRLDEIDEQISKLTALRDTITALQEHAADPDPAGCSPDDICRYL